MRFGCSIRFESQSADSIRESVGEIPLVSSSPRKRERAYQRLNKVVRPINRSPASWPTSSGSNGSPMTVCIAERMMTGNAVAYLSAFKRDRRGVGVDPV